MTLDWKMDLLAENSLREAYLVSKSLARSKFNFWAYRAVIAASVLVSGVWIYQKQIDISYVALMSITDTAFDLTVQILGFLIGGFAIFATISDSKLMVRLAQTKMKGSELSVFKTVFFNFISVFYIYVITLAMAIGVRTIATLKLVDAERFETSAVTSANAAAFCIMAAAVGLSVLRLKSFIWNIYQAFLTLLISSELIRTNEGVEQSSESASPPANRAQNPQSS